MIGRLMTMITVWAALSLTAAAGYQNLPETIFQPVAADTGFGLDSLIDTATVSQNQVIDKDRFHNAAHDSLRVIPRKTQYSDDSAAKIRKPWPTGALLLSVAIPGGGQFYNRKYLKSLLYGGTEIYLIKYVSWRWKQMDEHWRNFRNTDDSVIKAQQFALFEKRRDSRNAHIWLTALVVFVSMFDAYVDAHLADFNQTDKAFNAYIAPENDRVQLNLVYRF